MILRIMMLNFQYNNANLSQKAPKSAFSEPLQKIGATFFSCTSIYAIKRKIHNHKILPI